tara:strand:+ start:871 stop:2049 length:1179 start_codon:yes stop_codon:yes gene_type:complete
MNIRDTKIAIVHDWFLKKSLGGAENVTFLLDKILSKKNNKTDIFALASSIDNFENNFLKGRKIKTSFIQNLPFGKSKVQNYLPLLPFAIEQIDLNEYDLLVSSSHAFAKGILTRPDQLHISYIHTPMRYAWDQINTYLKQTTFAKYGFNVPLRYILFKLRQWDFISSQRIDFLIANSNFTAKRIKKYWGMESEVLHPPVEVERFNYNKTREDFYLSVNRLVPNKRIDLLVSAFNKLGYPLIIIGDGPEKLKLEKYARPNITFLNRISNLQVADYMSRCRAFVYAGLEDFGIAPVEAIASGAPVIAFGRGGILDTVNCLTTIQKDQIANGILFKKQTCSNIFDTVAWFEEKKIWKQFFSQDLNYYAKQFDSSNFITKMEFIVNKVWDDFQRKL